LGYISDQNLPGVYDSAGVGQERWRFGLSRERVMGANLPAFRFVVIEDPSPAAQRRKKTQGTD